MLPIGCSSAIVCTTSVSVHVSIVSCSSHCRCQFHYYTASCHPRPNSAIPSVTTTIAVARASTATTARASATTTAITVAIATTASTFATLMVALVPSDYYHNPCSYSQDYCTRLVSVLKKVPNSLAPILVAQPCRHPSWHVLFRDADL